MKKSIFLMLLLSSNLIFSQNTNTLQSHQNNCFSDAQVLELYKGLKQNEQLKKLYNSALETIDNSNYLIADQKKLIAKLSEESMAKNEVIDNLKSLVDKNNELCEIQKKTLQSDLDYLKEQSKKDSRKSFWKGVKTGGVTVVALGVVGLILAN